MDGGGFGVGSEATVAAEVRAAWQFSRRLNLVLGYGVLYLRVSNTVAEKTLVFEPTLYGPIFGLGIRLGKVPSS